MVKHIKNTKQKEPDTYLCEECLELLRALADKTRQEIIMVFATSKEICVNDIAKNFTLSRPTISHHLNLMKRAKVLSSRKEGKEIYYSINKSYIKNLITSVLDKIDMCC
ncbi:MAG: metalloregulator ArsR/SmtB family transcription factor [Bacteroidales bacterium]|jgi:DNA-binding transcriptional ArsR family regulator|nr:metalloregulator ArsR/SmtB family transcription factor [Bacteroidales bacterium]